MSNELTIVGSIAEINLNQREKILKIEILSRIATEYELLLTFENTCKVFYCKFATNNVLLTKEPLQASASNQNCINQTKLKVLLWKTLCLPFCVKDIFLSNKSLWAVGQDYVVDIKQHIENAVKSGEFNKSLNLEDDFMDIDAEGEFPLQEFKSSIKIPLINKHKLQRKTVCLKCNLIDNSILTCTKNLKTKFWQINITGHCLKSPDIKSIPLPDLPLTYDESILNFDSGSAGIIQDHCKPVITFMYRRDFSPQGPDKTKNNILHKLLTIDPVSSNCVCVIGHPEGNVLYFLCSKSVHNENFKVNTQMEQLCHIKQPIVGVHFIEEIKGIEGNGIILIIGCLGKLVFITVEQFFSNSEVIKTKSASIHAASLNLATSIHKHMVYQDCIFHISNNGDLWLSKLSNQTGKNPLKKIELSPSILMYGVADIVLLNNLEGLFLVVTMSGNLYVCKYTKQKEEQGETAMSLPSLMNEIMHQSTVLKNMAVIASCQHKFFAALSTFASLKYSVTGSKKCSISCSVTEMNESFKKFLLSINIKCPEKFNCEFWFVTVSLYSHFQKNSALVSKTIPFIPDQNINIEVQESLLCQPHASPFPIHVEVGLLLVLPEKFKSLACFQLVSKRLPMYLRIQTLILNELYFMKYKAPNSQNQSNLVFNLNSISSNIHKMSISKPISKLFQIEQNFLSSHPQSFTFCLLSTSAQEIVKSNPPGSHLASKIFHLLLKRSHLQSALEDSRLVCRKQPINVLVSAHDNNICITVHADSFLLLAGIRMAIMELLLNEQGKSKAQSSQYVQIPAVINKKCEKLSKDLLCILNEDSNATDFLEKIVFVYNNLRKDVSGVLPFC